jgi:hypothetical protein
MASCGSTLSFLGSGISPLSRTNPESLETRRQTNDWQMLAAHFCKDFSFTSKYPELEVVLQKIKEFIFTDNSNQKSNLLLCAKHSWELQTNLYLPSTDKPIECYQISRDLESPDDLEELGNLAIKKTEGNKEIYVKVSCLIYYY